MYSIVTYGFGPGGNVHEAPVYGFLNQIDIVDNLDIVIINIESHITRSINNISYIEKSLMFNNNILRNVIL